MPSAPPPPSEVKIRTMRSDLAAMAKSGGGLPRFETVRVEGLSIERQQAVAEGTAAAKKKSDLPVAIAVIFAVVALCAIGYFVYARYFAGSSSSGVPAAANTPAAVPSSTSAGTGAGTNAGASGAPGAAGAAGTSSAASTTGSIAPFAHASLFKKPADETLTLKLAGSGTASNATDLATFNQKLSSLLATAKKSSNFIEINPVGANGGGIAAGDVLAAANAAVLDPGFLAAHFSPDATFFAYRDASGMWPGYVLALKPSENWLFLNDQVKKLETSPNIPTLFLVNIGSPSVDGFTDSAISGNPVRVLSFINETLPAYFVYGWAKTYLIVSTSQSGYAAALAHLL